ncbi:MAG: SLBB domain-containing protein [Mediterranea sp.]|jgi:protein involved in polysaccharide export with SLBB domain|nr:SLBB domain-containing protein [Mediterranea sp.]
MRKLKFLIFFAFAMTATEVVLGQQMSDEQVVQYVKEASQSGKSQNVITTELLRRGITKEQVQRIQQKYQAQQLQQASGATGNQSSRLDRQQIHPTADELSTAAQDSLRLIQEKKSRIFGHDLFRNSNLTFVPSGNISAPANYRLGPGDEVVIQIWGASESTLREVITPEGNISVSGLGPVQLSGMTLTEANAYLQREFSKIYSGIGGENPNSQIKLTVGDIRTIQVDIMGEVNIPGTYTLSSFATLFNALYRADGINDIGTLRGIQVVREGKVLATVDVYEYILQGKTSDDIRLQDGDVIIVNPYKQMVAIEGEVKRPMLFELIPGETLNNLLNYSGGFTAKAYKDALTISRTTGREYRIQSVEQPQFASFILQDGDMVMIGSILDRYENRLEVKGSVYRPGVYQLDVRTNTVLQLIKAAEGVTGDAFLDRVLLDRENDDLTHSMISMNLAEMLDGTKPDIPLRRNDVLYIPSRFDLEEQKTVGIHGQVATPGTYIYSSDMTIGDLVVQAGGLLEDASIANVEITRRLRNPDSKIYEEGMGEHFVVNLDANSLTDDHTLKLQPFDEVYIRKSPAFRKPKNVRVEGEVLFDGDYALTSNAERLSELVHKAGGLTPYAYIRGARLIRRMTDDEKLRQQDILRVAKMSSRTDSIVTSTLETGQTYTVGINLDKALANPNGDDDMILNEGDVLIIPQMISTVKINGSVLFPNTVAYKHGEKLDYYINLAGGYTDRAKKSRAYVVYLNGTVSRIKGRDKNKIEPGCEIVIPTKPEKRPMGVGEILSIGTTSASLATMIATLVNLFTK